MARVFRGLPVAGPGVATTFLRWMFVRAAIRHGYWLVARPRIGVGMAW